MCKNPFQNTSQKFTLTEYILPCIIQCRISQNSTMEKKRNLRSGRRRAYRMPRPKETSLSATKKKMLQKTHKNSSSAAGDRQRRDVDVTWSIITFQQRGVAQTDVQSNNDQLDHTLHVQRAEERRKTPVTPAAIIISNKDEKAS